jgi:DNA repair exonuclease SbcCD ATPase subunit
LGQRNEVLNEMRVLEQQKAVLDPNDEQVNEINRQIEILENKINEIDYGPLPQQESAPEFKNDDNHSDSDHGNDIPQPNIEQPTNDIPVESRDEGLKASSESKPEEIHKDLDSESPQDLGSETHQDLGSELEQLNTKIEQLKAEKESLR